MLSDIVFKIIAAVAMGVSILSIWKACYYRTKYHSVFTKPRKRKIREKVSSDVLVNESGKLVDLNFRKYESNR